MMNGEFREWPWKMCLGFYPPVQNPSFPACRFRLICRRHAFVTRDSSLCALLVVSSLSALPAAAEKLNVNRAIGQHFIAPTMAANITFHPGSVGSSERCDLLKQKGVPIWLTGLSASGKVRKKSMPSMVMQMAHEYSVHNRLCVRATPVAPTQVLVQTRWRQRPVRIEQGPRVR